MILKELKQDTSTY